MGMFDHVRIEDGLDTELPEFNGDSASIDWQTKTFRHPRMDVYKITMDGRLFKEDAHYENVPEEERPNYNEKIGGFESDLKKLAGSRRKVHEGWMDTTYHGILEFHRHVDGEGYAYEAKFTDGELVEITRIERFGSSQ